MMGIIASSFPRNQCSRIDYCLALSLSCQYSDILLRHSRSRVSHHRTSSAVRAAHHSHIPEIGSCSVSFHGFLRCSPQLHLLPLQYKIQVTILDYWEKTKVLDLRDTMKKTLGCEECRVAADHRGHRLALCRHLRNQC